MWSRNGLVRGNTPGSNATSSAAMYSSTPHLFVYQEDEEEVALPLPPYPESSSGSAGSYDTPEAIYYTASSVSREKDAIQRLGRLKVGEDSVCSSNSSETSYSSSGPLPGSSGSDVGNNINHLTELELLRVETFFRGNRTQIFVGKSLANLYLREAKSLVGLNRCSSQPDVCSRTLQRAPVSQSGLTDWQLKFTGIPVVLLDTGSTKSRTQRRIQLVLAERGTGFTLWRDTIDNLSNYEAAGPTFHTMRTSTDHRVIAGLSFDSADAAQQLFRHIETLTSDPANIRLSSPNKNAGAGRSTSGSFLRRFWTSKPKPMKMPVYRKSEISQPCFFQHVTSVDSTDRTKFFSLQALVHHP